jgi:mannose-binding lectin 2
MSQQRPSKVSGIIMKILSNYVCLIAIMIVSCQQICAEKISSHSFEAPFRDIDNSGSRMVNKNWRSHGSTVINKNFVRLTPDQQSKKGALWSREPLGISSFSSIIKFRISGRGKDFFGDGIALWFVQQGFYNEGEVHGFQEQYKGVGVVFDTFKNMENPASHRDVTVLINDGEKTWKMMVEDVQVCIYICMYLYIYRVVI